MLELNADISTNLLQQLCAIEVLGVGRTADKYFYLVLFDDLKNRLLTSTAAQKICPAKMIEFYTKKCYWEDGQLFVPSEFVIGK